MAVDFKCHLVMQMKVYKQISEIYEFLEYKFTQKSLYF